MISSLRKITAAATIAAVFASSAFAASPGWVDFGKFDAEAGEQYVEVDINPALLRLAAAFTKNQEPEVADLLRSLERVRVNVFGVNDENRGSIVTRINSVRDDLDAQGWTRVVTVREKSGDDVAVFLKESSGDSIHGVVVTVIGKNGEAVLVNIVGDVALDQIAALGESLDIDPLRELHVARRAKS
ncbi:DUF4252 domain-containing protein [Synoicihabitans lomoniglobus]|uniref:DUF4252 domain-containing protein n=1 Tax=Synoicihabitans lomoniglobus TaxID=2909285 RepID=A0AAF0I721_9BACT|nr:DUF4252 domain-containing protein [Opitutaceae bacterium LMO-M01]WED66436.1 DUF4252 domain-containing protein [Opitutaceae bacterium LMO-M01]